MISPEHVAFIMDGNGRWGEKKYKNRILGHQAGIENIKPLVIFFLKNKIKNLTLYALSKDNFLKRKKKEIDNIFLLLEKYLSQNNSFFNEHKINLNFFGEKKKLPKKIKKIINKANLKFQYKNANLNLNIAFNYSSRLEILSSLKKIIKEKKSVNVKNLSSRLYLNFCNNPEIIIRTGGYKRLSDFLLWQTAYSEIFFLNKLWPDFKVSDLKKILNKFKSIKRNFGA